MVPGPLFVLDTPAPVVHHIRKSAPLRRPPPLARNRARIGRDEELTLAKSAKVAKTRRIVDSLTLGVFAYLSLFPFILLVLFVPPRRKERGQYKLTRMSFLPCSRIKN